MDVFDLRMIVFSQKLQFVFKHFTTMIITGVANSFMHRWSTWSTVVRCIQNHPHSRSRSSYIPFRYVVRYRQNIFVLGEMYCYSFTSGKTYLVIQMGWIVKWFRYPCYDVGCFPWFYVTLARTWPWMVQNGIWSSGVKVSRFLHQSCASPVLSHVSFNTAVTVFSTAYILMLFHWF